MANNAKTDDYELDVASGDQPQPFDNPYNNASTLPILGSDSKRNNSDTGSDGQDDNSEDWRHFEIFAWLRPQR
jgi:hypothetical protein